MCMCFLNILTTSLKVAKVPLCIRQRSTTTQHRQSHKLSANCATNLAQESQLYTCVTPTGQTRHVTSSQAKQQASLGSNISITATVYLCLASLGDSIISMMVRVIEDGDAGAVLFTPALTLCLFSKWHSSF